MRYFFTAALCTIILLIIFTGFQQGSWRNSSLPADYEQADLSKQIVIRFSHVVAENTPKGLAAIKFAELVEEKTNGQIRVEVYPNGMLYSDDTEMRALQDGDIQMIAPTFSKVTQLIPEWQILDLPYLFNDYRDIEKAFTGNVGEHLLNKLNRKNIKGLALWSNGFKQMTAKDHPLVTKEDFQNVKIRTMPSEMLNKQFAALGAKPVNASFDQVFSILEKHEIAAQENTLSNIYSKGFYRVQDYLTISNHGFLGYAVMMNEDFWYELSDELQMQVQEAINETTLWNLTQSEQMNNDTLQKLQHYPELTIHTLSPEEKAKWQEAFQPLYEHYEKDINSSLIQEIKKDIN